MTSTENIMLITVISERLLEGKLVELLKELGARGYSISYCRGDSQGAVRASEWEGENVKIEALLSHALSDKMLERVRQDFFDNYAIVIYRSEVEVIRGEKFAQ